MYRAEVTTLNSLSLTLFAHHLSSSVFEVTATSLAEYCEKLQQRRSRVARLVRCRRMSTLRCFRHFVIYMLQPPATLVEDNKEKWVDKGVDKGHMKRDLGIKKKVDYKFDFAFTS